MPRGLHEQLEGALVVLVRTWNADDEQRALEDMRRNVGSDIHAHGRLAQA
jgi:hypothetical protein